MNAKTVISRGFEPVECADASVLILGTLPGGASLEKCQYYADPRNAFWRIMGKLVGAKPEVQYRDRLRALRESGIALWDVCAAAQRPGNSDSKIQWSTCELNNFCHFLFTHPSIRLICFNGKKAGEVYVRRVRPYLGPSLRQIQYEVLPSTAGANTTMNFEQKLSRWNNILGEVIRPN